MRGSNYIVILMNTMAKIVNANECRSIVIPEIPSNRGNILEIL